MKENCLTCKYCVKELSRTGYNCHRYPIVEDTVDNYWCGEYKKRVR